MLRKIKRRLKGGLDPQSVVDEFMSYCSAVRNGRAPGFHELAEVDSSIYAIWEAAYRTKLLDALTPVGRDQQLHGVHDVLIDALDSQDPIAVVYGSSVITAEERNALFDGKKPGELHALLSHLDILATDVVLSHYFKDDALSPAVISLMHLPILHATLDLKTLATASDRDHSSSAGKQAAETIACAAIRKYCDHLIGKLRSGWIPTEQDEISTAKQILPLRKNLVPITAASDVEKLRRVPLVLWPFLERAIRKSDRTIQLDLARLAILDICSFLVLVERYAMARLPIETVKLIVDEVFDYFESALADYPSKASTHTTVALIDHAVSNRDQLIQWISHIAGVMSIPYLDRPEREAAFVVTKLALLLGLLELGSVFRPGQSSLLPEDESIASFMCREKELIDALDRIFV